MTFVDETVHLAEPAEEEIVFRCGVGDCDYTSQWPAPVGSHKRLVHDIAGANTKKGTKAKKPAHDKAPTSVNVNLGSPRSSSKDKELAAVEARAVQLMQTAAALLLLTGHADDAGDVAKGAEPWGKSVRELAVYEDWLRKLASGGEIAGRTMAWVNVALVTLAIIVPILSRHDVLPDNLAQMATGMFGVAETLQAEPEAA
jgi:hypothetical protein